MLALRIPVLPFVYLTGFTQTRIPAHPTGGVLATPIHLPKMLLTLSAHAFASRLATKKGKAAANAMNLIDLPRYTREELGLYGLNLTTSLLAGADMKKLDAVRDAADKASCPCLVLIESDAQPLATLDEAKGTASVERMVRVVQAASRLGCNSVAMRIVHDEHTDAFDFAAERVRMILQRADKLEVNVLISPHTGFSADPERLTDLIKRIGGFRIGTLPDFFAASQSPDPLLYLRRLVPYAQAITATAVSFKIGKKGEELVHEPYDLAAYAKVVESVGYTGTMAIDVKADGDPTDTLLKARQVFETALGMEVAEP